jgi:hypothetical protein
MFINSGRQSMIKASQAEKIQTKLIIERITDHIPTSGYVQAVQAVLTQRGIVKPGSGEPYGPEQIRNTRNLRAYHLPVAKVFEELYDPAYRQKPAGERGGPKRKKS